MEIHHHAVTALVESVCFDHPDHVQGSPMQTHPVVTLSRKYGANGSKTAELLAQRLAVRCYGYTLLDSIVSTLKSNKHLTKRFDEKYVNTLDDWILSLLTGGKGSQDEYLKCLVKAVTVISKDGGVIIGRAAHLLLANNPAVFRVMIEGSLEVRAKRIMERENVALATAKKRIAEVDNERKEFVRGVYQHFPNDLTHYDLVINSDRLEPAQMVDIIQFAMAQRDKPASSHREAA
ncbi:MAG: cytidylate kinase-like family protein [Magnetococcales bacterium]|nr:cytidylate kinase-like family protein [Magnetococcales bacterium]NGZ26124.1 cytidylate kinase-like family protein [Magnetococcales bacterium]